MGKKETKNIERPQSQQELRLLETQNAQLQKGIAVAENQEARSQEQYDQYKRDFLPDMTMNGASARGNEDAMRMMDNQMPDYAEDTSGARDSTFNQQPQQQPQQLQQRGGAKGKSAKGGA